MSKADKSATRSARKANLFRGPRLKLVRRAPNDSWWAKAAQPNQRDEFMLLAHERDDASGWKANAVPHAGNPSKAYR